MGMYKTALDIRLWASGGTLLFSSIETFDSAKPSAAAIILTNGIGVGEMKPAFMVVRKSNENCNLFE